MGGCGRGKKIGNSVNIQKEASRQWLGETPEGRNFKF